MIDTALGGMLDSHIMTTEPGCAAITAVCVASHVEIMHPDVELSSR